jgi:hypothetical protein
MSLRSVVNGLLLLCVIACSSVAAMASAYHGQVTFSGLPLPGSTVTVTATQGDKKVVAISDDQGLFSFTDLTDGKWSLSIEMTGFSPLKQEITVAPDAAVGTFEMKVLTIDQIRAEDKPVKFDPAQLANPPTITVVSAPSAATAAAAKGKQAAGDKTQAAAGTPSEAAPPPDATAQQANDGYLINGSVNNAATSQFSMNAAFGNNRNGGRSLYNGNVHLVLENSALDAQQYSLTGTPVAKPQFNDYQFDVNYGGPLNIKHLMPRGPYFQVNYSHQQNNDYNTQTALFPTGEDAFGNWNLGSSTVTSITVPSDLATVAPACNAYLLAHPAAEQVPAGSPAGTPPAFTNNTIPAQCVTNTSNVLLGLYPKLTQANTVTGDPAHNFQLPLNSSSQSDSLGLTLNKQIGTKNSVYGRFNFSDSRSNNPSIFGFLDTSTSLGMNTSINYNRRFTQRLSGNVSYSFSRGRSETTPYFSNKNNIQATAGINGASTVSTYWGPPSLGFSSGITGLSDGIYSYNPNETNGVSLSFYWNHLRHNVQFGGDFRRQEFNFHTQTNPYGSLSFTGAATQVPTCTAPQTCTNAGTGGSDLADFLLGIPDTSAIAYGNADKYLRQSAYDLFLNDDFRVNPEFSLSAGIRWEYGAPVTETKGRLVNLDITPGFAQEAPVLATNPKGSLTGMSYPTSLVHPDYSRPEPHIGIAWRPISGSSLLIRSGYDVTNDTSVYQSEAYAMAQQAPLSTSLRISNSTTCSFNIVNPFVQPGCSTTSPDTFAIDPHFKVGYVQTWNLSAQRDLPFSLQANVTYLGTKGTRGVQEILPNSCPPQAADGSTTCPYTGVSGYEYRTSNGNLSREAGSIELRRRPRNGFQARLLYTYAKSLDDDYSLSGQGSVSNGSGIAQDWTNPAGQRALSITDQRNLLDLTAQYTTGMGLGGKMMLSGWRGAIYKEWTVVTTFVVGSGLPETPIYGGATVSGTGISGTIRPNVTGSPYAGAKPGYVLNSAAYSQPIGMYGDARRNSIEGPAQFSLNAGMNRTFRLHGKYTLDAQLQANNVLNHVVYTGWNTTWIPNSLTFGAPVNTNQMRSVSLSLRARF